MQPPAAIIFVRPLISHVKIWEGGLCPSPPSSTVSDIYISQVLEVDFYTPTSFFFFAYRPQVISKTILCLLLCSPILLFLLTTLHFHKWFCVEKTKKPLRCETTEVPGETLVEGRDGSILCFGAKMCRALLYFFSGPLIGKAWHTWAWQKQANSLQNF